jgi:hypothetical protein
MTLVVRHHFRSIVAVACVFTAAGGAMPGAARAQGETALLEIPQFLAELDRLSAEVEADPGRAAALANRLPERWLVRVRGHVIDVPTRGLVQMLRAGAARGQRARPDTLTARLAVLRSEAREAFESPPRDHAGAAVALQDVLSRPEFQPGWAAAWTRSLRERIVKWVRTLWSNFGGGSFGSRQLALTFAWTAALLAFVVLALAVARVLSRATRVTGLRLPQPSPERGSREWVDRAMAAARAGNAREAVRCAFRAAIERFAEEGVWRVDDSRTPREYVALLPAHHHRRAPLVDLTRLFEQVWYGRRPAAPDDAAGLARRLEDLGCLPRRQT